MLISTFLREQDRRYRRPSRHHRRHQHRRQSSTLTIVICSLAMMIMVGCITYLLLNPELEPFDYSRCDAIVATADPARFDPNNQSVVKTPDGDWCVEYTLEGYLNTLGYEQ